MPVDFKHNRGLICFLVCAAAGIFSILSSRYYQSFERDLSQVRGRQKWPLSCSQKGLPQIVSLHNTK
jgi:hypothetical protein